MHRMSTSTTITFLIQGVLVDRQILLLTYKISVSSAKRRQMASIVNIQNSLLNKLIDLIEIKRKSIFKLIDEKRGNVSKEQIKTYINEIVVIIENENINQQMSQQMDSNLSKTPSQISESEDNNQIDVIDVPKSDGQNSGFFDNYKSLKTEDKLDIIFHKVLDLTSKVESNEKLINQNLRQTKSSQQQRQSYFKPQLKRKTDLLMKTSNDNKLPQIQENRKTRKITNNKNFYPIYESYDNHYRRLLQTKQISSQMPYNYDLSQHFLEERHIRQNSFQWQSQHIPGR